MENKYFTPDIEDFCIGYEYETIYLKSVWTKESLRIIDAGWFFESYQNDAVPTEFRVPYLTKEQIEAEGWKFDYNLGDFDYYIKTVNNTEYELEFCYKQRININIWKRTLYHGECKDINTFRKIIKLLGI